MIEDILVWCEVNEWNWEGKPDQWFGDCCCLYFMNISGIQKYISNDYNLQTEMYRCLKRYYDFQCLIIIYSVQHIYYKSQMYYI